MLSRPTLLVATLVTAVAGPLLVPGVAYGQAGGSGEKQEGLAQRAKDVVSRLEQHLGQSKKV